MGLQVKKYYLSSFDRIYYLFEQHDWYGSQHFKGYDVIYNGKDCFIDKSGYYTFYADGRRCGRVVEKLIKEFVHRDIIFGR